MEKKVLRVSPLPFEGAGKLHQRFTLEEVPVYMREELLAIISFYHVDVVDGKLISERAVRFGDWLDRAMKEALFDADEASKNVLLDLPGDHGFLLPAFQKVVEEKGFFPVYVLDREDPWRMLITPLR
ncbi:MAG: hypothetical protein WA091_02765 [Minisyncoccales bacterium]